MAKNNGTVKRVTRKRSTAPAPRTARKPRLAAAAMEELAATAPPIDAALDAPFDTMVETAPVAAEAAPVAPSVSVVPTPPIERQRMIPPSRRARRVAMVRAMLRRLRRAAERRGAPIARRLGARFPRLAAIGETLRRWF
jgi:hypothetical protein